MRPETAAIRVGILIPCYNNAGTIAETLESIQQQDALDELTGVYLADDGCTDNTVAVARNAWKTLPQLTIQANNLNRGQWPNVNRALHKLSKELDWLLILHADDRAKSHWLRLTMERIKNCAPHVASVCSSWDGWLPDGSIISGEDDPNRPVEFIRGNRAAIRHTLLAGCWWHISGCAIRLEAFRDVGDFIPGLPQQGDWEWLLRGLEGGWDAEYIPRTLILYRQHIASVSSASFRENRDIGDSLQIVARYKDALSPGEWLRFHVRLLVFSLKRLGKSLLTADFIRSKRCLRTAVTITISAVQTR